MLQECRLIHAGSVLVQLIHMIEEHKAANDNLHLSQLMMVEYGFSRFEESKSCKIQ